MKTSRFETRVIHVPIDASEAIPLLQDYYKEEKIANISLKITKTFRSKDEIVKVITDVLHFDIEYGLMILAHLFPELFSNKRFLNRLKKYLA